MNIGKTLFAQVMEYVPWKNFGRIIDRYGGDAGVRTLSCADLFRVMAFAQLTWRESLRDIEVCLSANDEQHGAAAADHRRALQEPLAGRTVFQVDQATPAHQALFGHQRERRQDANLVRRIDLRADCHRQEGASFGGLALHIATDFVGVGF